MSMVFIITKIYQISNY